MPFVWLLDKRASRLKKFAAQLPDAHGAGRPRLACRP